MGFFFVKAEILRVEHKRLESQRLQEPRYLRHFSKSQLWDSPEGHGAATYCLNRSKSLILLLPLHSPREQEQLFFWGKTTEVSVR